MFKIIFNLEPEVLIHNNHSYTVDYFALGVLTYELMMGRVFIFYGRDHLKEEIEMKLKIKSFNKIIH